MGTTVPNGLCDALDDAFHMFHVKRHRRFGCCALMAAGPRRGSGVDLEGVADVGYGNTPVQLGISMSRASRHRATQPLMHCAQSRRWAGGHRRPAPAHMRRGRGNERVFHVKHPRIIGRSAPLACTRPPPAHAAQWRSTIHARRRRDWTVGTAAWERDRSGSVSAGRHGQPMRSGAISSSVAQLLRPFRRSVERCTLRRSSFEWKTCAAGSSMKTWRE